jgi:hypothetical protein
MDRPGGRALENMKSPSPPGRQERRAAALRENLKRRKAKERAEASTPGAEAETREIPDASQKFALKKE